MHGLRALAAVTAAALLAPAAAAAQGYPPPGDPGKGPKKAGGKARS